ncbi:glycoside hydrolase family 16 protein [Pedobacter frigoris]|uniref:Glycosyl hydrolase family protein n=1 Tax=Pedobacter frigoris TaxID=2571272 RepID=A0A4U1CKD6_9SPHI|nr:glycoside hydrolase family 16 protein [Pedobacter frigoris]TKC07096.1 glycosyl hydrolase family protein [Pedobacter frigoris]
MRAINKTLILTGLSIVFITSIACKKSKAVKQEPIEEKPAVTDYRPAHIIKDYNLFWQDEFNGSTLDLTKWKYRAEGSVRQHATVSRNTISLDGKGNLLIKVTKDESGKYYVGQTTTDGLFSTRYGYFECRAKMNSSIGPHVAFWLQSNTMGTTTNDPANNGVEIDIFEYHRKTPDKINHNLHWDGYGTAHKTKETVVAAKNIDDGQFHTFALEWTETQYVFYVDGIETWRTTEAISKIPEYIILSTELTGYGGTPSLGTYPDQITFDYVRVYKPK